jgi:hypothetical protein
MMEKFEVVKSVTSAAEGFSRHLGLFNKNAWNGKIHIYCVGIGIRPPQKNFYGSSTPPFRIVLLLLLLPIV